MNSSSECEPSTSGTEQTSPSDWHSYSPSASSDSSSSSLQYVTTILAPASRDREPARARRQLQPRAVEWAPFGAAGSSA